MMKTMQPRMTGRFSVVVRLFGVLAAVWMLFAGAASQAAESFKEGLDYKVLEQPGSVDDPSRVEVREFFWYGCPHCFQLESVLADWKKKMPAGVNFVRMPPALNDAWIPHAHAYYIAESIGKVDEVSEALFDTLHVKKERIMTEDQLATFFTRFGMSEDDFRKLYNSFAIRTKVRMAKTTAVSYKLTGVPAIVVNGKYLVEISSAKSYPRMMEIVNFLVAKEKAATGGA